MTKSIEELKALVNYKPTAEELKTMTYYKPTELKKKQLLIFNPCLHMIYQMLAKGQLTALDYGNKVKANFFIRDVDIELYNQLKLSGNLPAPIKRPRRQKL